VSDDQFDLIIQGGGLTGLALAAALANTDCRAALVEARPLEQTLAAPFDGRVTAVARAARRMLEAIGAWATMARTAEPIRHIEVADAAGMASVHYDSADVGDQPMGHIVENRMIRQALLATVEAADNIDVMAPSEIAALKRDRFRIEATAQDGRRLQARLLALCEGRLSASRERLGIASTRTTYDQTAIVCTLIHDNPHQGTAIERFFSDGPFAILPLNGNRSSIVWALANDSAPAIIALDDDAFAAEVAERFGDRLGGIRLEGRRWHYPLTLVTSERLVAERVALVGDTARGIHPIAGQGWNLALRDVAALAEIIVDSIALGLDPGQTDRLERYAAWRRVDGLTLVGVTDGINSLFSNDNALLRIARDAGLATVEHLPVAKRLFMRHAMGELGDLPRLMRGERLC